MEIVDEIPLDELQRKISYLLGVRHHGSLVQWTPFAQAHNIFKRYIEISGQDSESFMWDNDTGKEVADALSIPSKEVYERLKVYRAMSQIGMLPEIKDSQGGIKDRYYSVFAELLLKEKNRLNDYIKQDLHNFHLEDEGLERFDNLCHFSIPRRDGAPIKNPQEWRSLEKILRDEDEEIRKQMLEEVEEAKTLPSIVWAKRAAELQKLQWDKWLLKITSILKTVTFGDDLSSEDAKATVARLVSLISKLEERDISGGASDGKNA